MRANKARLPRWRSHCSDPRMVMTNRNFEMKNVLFLCSQNKLRSPTAEAIFAGREGFDVRSAGLNNDAVVNTTPELVEWADYIFVMEKAHRSKLQKRFKRHLNKQRIICLDIRDEYEYMDDELIRLLKHRLGPFFNHP